MSEVPAVPEHGAWAAVQAAPDQAARVLAGQHAIEVVRWTAFGLPIPRLADDLPWAQSNGETVDAILVNLIGAANIVDATDAKTLRKVEDIVGQPVEIFDLRARESDIQPDKPDQDPGGWGLYLSLDVSVDRGPREVVNVGSKQVIVTLWRCWCEGRFPVIGVFRKLGTATKGRNQPIGFQVEEAFSNA